MSTLRFDISGLDPIEDWNEIVNNVTRIFKQYLADYTGSMNIGELPPKLAIPYLSSSLGKYTPGLMWYFEHGYDRLKYLASINPLEHEDEIMDFVNRISSLNGMSYNKLEDKIYEYVDELYNSIV